MSCSTVGLTYPKRASRNQQLLSWLLCRPEGRQAPFRTDHRRQTTGPALGFGLSERGYISNVGVPKNDAANDAALSSEPLVRSTDYSLYVVTACADDEPSGCLAGFVTQASIDPVRFIVCISKINHTFGVAMRSTGLGLHLLGADQRATASRFGEQTGDVIDKFERVQWTRGSTGAPILAECAAWVEGQVIDRMSGGDHEAFLIAVLGGGEGTHSGRLTKVDAADFEPGHPQ